jgi:hypothetical protein
MVLGIFEAEYGEKDSQAGENPMMNQIVVHGRPVKLYTPDGGHTRSSNPQSIAAYGQRVELRKSFAQIDEMRDLEPNNLTELHTPKSLTKVNKKNQAHSIVGKVRLDRLAIGRQKW